MKECPRCGFLNPDKGEYCIKCRFMFGGILAGGQTGPQAGAGPVPDTDDQAIGPAGDESASKPELIPPQPDLDDTFSGRMQFEAGGYQIGGIAPVKQSKPPPSDAHAIMTGQAPEVDRGAPRPGSKKPPRKRKKKTKKLKGAPPPLVPPGARRGSPPPAMRRKPPSGAPAPGQAFGGSMGGQAIPPSQAVGGAGPPPGQAVRRKPPARPSPKRPAKRRPSVPKPKLEFLPSTEDLVTPRNVTTLVAGLLLLFALVYMAAGGNYFVKPETGTIYECAGAMSSLPSVKLNASLSINSAKLGSINGNVTYDWVSDGDFSAVYVYNAPDGALVNHAIVADGKAYDTLEDGAWSEARDPQDYLLSLDSMFSNASAVRVVGNESVAGVECEHLAFTGGSSFAKSLFPAAEIPTSASFVTEVWICSGDDYLRRVVQGGEGLESKDFGEFNYRADVTFSGFGAPLDIRPPI